MKKKVCLTIIGLTTASILTTIYALSVSKEAIASFGATKNPSSSRIFEITNFSKGTDWSGGYTYYNHEYDVTYRTQLNNPIIFHYTTDTQTSLSGPTNPLNLLSGWTFGCRGKLIEGHLGNTFTKITSITVNFTGTLRVSMPYYTFNEAGTSVKSNYFYINEEKTKIYIQLTSGVPVQVSDYVQYNNNQYPTNFTLSVSDYGSATVTSIRVTYEC